MLFYVVCIQDHSYGNSGPWCRFAVGWGGVPLGRNDVGNQLTEAGESKISGQTTPFV